MKDNLTEIVFILDRSGSMESMSSEAIGGFNSFLEEQKKVPGDVKLTLVLFDHDYTMVHNGVNLSDVQPLTKKTYVPRGTTALLDALGRTIDDVGRRLSSTVEDERPSKILVAVLTDGQENASRDYRKSRISEMVSHQSDKYSWKFVFLAANQDAIAEGHNLGISKSFSMTYDSNSASGYARVFDTLSVSTTALRMCASASDFKGLVNTVPDQIEPDKDQNASKQ